MVVAGFGLLSFSVFSVFSGLYDLAGLCFMWFCGTVWFCGIWWCSCGGVLGFGSGVLDCLDV